MGISEPVSVSCLYTPIMMFWSFLVISIIAVFAYSLDVGMKISWRRQWEIKNLVWLVVAVSLLVSCAILNEKARLFANQHDDIRISLTVGRFLLLLAIMPISAFIITINFFNAYIIVYVPWHEWERPVDPIRWIDSPEQVDWKKEGF